MPTPLSSKLNSVLLILLNMFVLLTAFFARNKLDAFEAALKATAPLPYQISNIEHMAEERRLTTEKRDDERRLSDRRYETDMVDVRLRLAKLELQVDELLRRK